MSASSSARLRADQHLQRTCSAASSRTLRHQLLAVDSESAWRLKLGGTAVEVQQQKKGLLGSGMLPMVNTFVDETAARPPKTEPEFGLQNTTWRTQTTDGETLAE